MEKARTKLGSEILCVDSYLGIKSIIKKSQQIESELKAVAEIANAGEFDTVMMEDTCAQLKTKIVSNRVKHLPSSSKTLQGNLIHQEADHSMCDISVSTVSQQKNESTPTRSISLLYPKHRPKKLKEIKYADKSTCRKKVKFSDCNMPT